MNITSAISDSRNQKKTISSEAAQANPNSIISLICEHNFEMESLATALRYVFTDAEIRRYDKPTEWERNKSRNEAEETVLYSLGDLSVSDDGNKLKLRDFIEKAGARRVIVISRNDDMMAIFDAVDCGATSYIPSNVGFDDLVEAVRMSSSKSVVIPRRSMLALRGAIPSQDRTTPGLERYFTERQLSVAKALQRGAANKTIAYQLGLCESTVKVHIRSIMRKLRATNRTEAAYRLNELANGSTDVIVSTDP